MSENDESEILEEIEEPPKKKVILKDKKLKIEDNEAVSNDVPKLKVIIKKKSLFVKRAKQESDSDDDEDGSETLVSEGIVYKITCNLTGKCYYGSTQQTLAKRKSVHKLESNMASSREIV